MARTDETMVRLAVAYNEVVRRNMVGKLPDDLQGNVIPDQIEAHENALHGRRNASTAESATRETAADIYEQTARYLTRVRHALLAAYNDPEDPRIALFGELGLGRGDKENQERLATLAPKLSNPLKEGEIALVKDLDPESLLAHAKKHGELAKGKAGATAGRQVESSGLSAVREESKQMLQRLKNFVKSFCGAEELEAFGFGLPAPAVRPRLKDEPEPTE